MTTPNVNTNQNISLCRNVLFVILTETTRRGKRPSCYESVIHLVIKGKVKCTLVQALRLCTGRTAHRASRGIALFVLDYGTRRGWGVSLTSRPLFTPGKKAVPILQEDVWLQGAVWAGAENLVPTGIRFPDRLARSQSLYRLRYPTHIFSNWPRLNKNI